MSVNVKNHLFFFYRIYYNSAEISDESVFTDRLSVLHRKEAWRVCTERQVVGAKLCHQTVDLQVAAKQDVVAVAGPAMQDAVAAAGPAMQDAVAAAVQAMQDAIAGSVDLQRVAAMPALVPLTQIMMKMFLMLMMMP